MANFVDCIITLIMALVAIITIGTLYIAAKYALYKILCKGDLSFMEYIDRI